MRLSRDDFVGAWSLVDWRIEYANGRVTRPFGEQPRGQLVYTRCGAMSATVSRFKREPLAQASARSASLDQKASAFDSYFHYAGRWQLDGDAVIHQVELALNSDMVGSQQRRVAKFDGAGGLTLSAVEALGDGQSREHILTWQRLAQE